MQEVIRKGFNPFLEKDLTTNRQTSRIKKQFTLECFNDFFSSLEYKENKAVTTKQALVKYLELQNISIAKTSFSDRLSLFQSFYKFNIDLKVKKVDGEMITIYEVEKY